MAKLLIVAKKKKARATNSYPVLHRKQKKALPKKKPGPKAETLKVEGDWEDAVKHAMKRGKPPKPKHEK